MRIVAISDTHGKHGCLRPLPEGDILVHAGDVSRGGTKAQIIEFLDWFAAQSHPYKLFVAGNHDFFFEQASLKEVSALIPTGITYLHDSGIAINGVKFWGSPITPWFNNWAFNRHPGSEIKRHWDLIPDNTDVLITHGPPYGILDETVYSRRVGCEELLRRIHQVKPKYHIFGHIHEDYGTLTKEQTTFINASVLDDWYEVKNQASIFDV